jgi:RloB-like protein
MNSKKKPWGKWRLYPKHGRRKEDTIPERQVVLIVCEGEKTEPYYFQSFPIDPAKVEIDGTGHNSDSLVELAIAKKKKAKDKKTPYLQVWCVFDRDAFSGNNINRAFQLAKSNKIKIAYSNEAFELWFLLHFNFIDTACNRKDLRRKLSRLVPGGYKKNCENMYDILDDGNHKGKNQKQAINNAKKLESIHSPTDKLNNNPSSTVYKLVEDLNKLIENDE